MRGSRRQNRKKLPTMRRAPSSAKHLIVQHQMVAAAFQGGVLVHCRDAGPHNPDSIQPWRVGVGTDAGILDCGRGIVGCDISLLLMLVAKNARYLCGPGNSRNPYQRPLETTRDRPRLDESSPMCRACQAPSTACMARDGRAAKAPKLTKRGPELPDDAAKVFQLHILRELDQWSVHLNYRIGVLGY